MKSPSAHARSGAGPIPEIDGDGLSSLTSVTLDRHGDIFHALFNNFPTPIFILNSEGRILEANPAAAKMQNTTPEQMVGRYIADLDDHENAARVSERIAQILSGKSLQFQVKHVLPDGSQAPLEVFATTFEQDGEKRIISFNHDISARLAAEELIRKSAERPGLALSGANQGLYDLNVQTGECIVNDEYAKMLGYDPQSFVETNAAWIERLHPDDHERVGQNYLDYVSGKIKDYRVEFRQRMADGRWKWILSIGKIIEYDDQGNPLRFVGTHTDISDMKAAQQIIERDAERSRQALSSTKQGFFECNLQTGKCVVSQEYAEMLGYKPEEMLDVHSAYLAHLHPDDLQAAQREVRDFSEGRVERMRSEFRMSTRDGRWLWVLGMTGVVEHDADGRPLRVSGTHTDISDMKAAQEIIRKDAERSNIALQSTNQGVFDCNMQTGEAYVSKEFAQMLGYEPHEMRDIKTAWINHLHPEDSEAAQKRSRDFAEGRLKEYRSEFRMKTRDGQWKWILSMANIVDRDNNGEALRMVGTHTDITEMKLGQEEVLKKAERPQLALSSAKHALWDYNTKTQECHCNDEYALMLGYDPETFVETFERFAQRLHPEDKQRVLDHLDDYVADKTTSFHEEFRERTKAGGWVWIQSTGKIIERDELGTPTRIIGMRINISDMKAAEEDLERRRLELMQSERVSLANGLAAVVAHELNQPLCTIVNHMAALKQHLASDRGDPQAVKQNAESASAAAFRAADIVRRFRALFSKDAPSAQPCSLPELIDQSIDLIRGEFRKAGVRVERHFDPATPQFIADPVLLQQVILNLAQNALDAMRLVPEDNRVLQFSLSTEDGGNTVLLRVADTGPGFSSEAIKKLFEANHSTKAGGLGMGLCICRLIVRSHGGDIALEKTSAEGSTILVRLHTDSENAAKPDPDSEV